MRLLVSVAAMVCASAVCSASATAASLDQLRGFLTQTTSARGDFVQNVMGRGKPQSSSGNFVFQRPGRFRWIYVKPYEQVIVADGERLVLYDKDLNQVTIKPLSASLPSSPASILFGSNDFEREFEVTDAGTRDGLEWIVAKPRAKDSPFNQIEIGFRDALPGAMRLVDTFGQTTVLNFAKVERNPKLAPDAFAFTPPKGADILK